MKQPGLQTDMKGPEPSNKQLPTEDGGYQTYKAARKLEGKKAVITGGDSGIGRAIAILYAMEGAESLIAYLPNEQSDAEDTKKQVENHGGKCHLYAADLREKENCQKVIDEAVSKMGGINILVNNAAYQNMTNGIDELTEYVYGPSFGSLVEDRYSSSLQRSMAHYLQHKHPSLFLPEQVCAQTSQARRYHHQQRLGKLLHWPA